MKRRRKKKSPQDVSEAPEPLSNMGFVCSQHQKKPNPIFKKKSLDFFIGKYCQLAFPTLIDTEEYMWVKTIKLAEDKREELHGILSNDPAYPTNLQCGDAVEFSRHEILEIFEEGQDG